MNYSIEHNHRSNEDPKLLLRSCYVLSRFRVSPSLINLMLLFIELCHQDECVVLPMMVLRMRVQRVPQSVLEDEDRVEVVWAK